MTWRLVLLVAFAMGAPLICGLSPACAGSLETIDSLSKVVIGGVFGAVIPQTARRLKAKKRKPKEIAP
jgi:hypothetical protein